MKMIAKPSKHLLTTTAVLVSACCAGLAQAQTNSLQPHVVRRISVGQNPRDVAGISVNDEKAAQSGSALAPTGSAPAPNLFRPSVTRALGTGTIVYTCDPSIDATAPGTCSYLNTTIAGIYATTFANANANIYIQFGITGLGESAQYLNFVSYGSYLSALQLHSSGDVIDVDSLVSLPATETGSL